MTVDPERQFGPLGGSIMDKYLEKEGFRLATLIDSKMALYIRPRPWWCPKWLYKKVIKSSTMIVNRHD